MKYLFSAASQLDFGSGIFGGSGFDGVFGVGFGPPGVVGVGPPGVVGVGPPGVVGVGPPGIGPAGVGWALGCGFLGCTPPLSLLGITAGVFFSLIAAPGGGGT